MNNESQKLLDEVLTETNKSTNWWPLIYIIALFIILWFLNGWLLMGYTNDERGTIGDMFGASNSLFSGLALAAVAYSIWLQRNELQLQRKVTLLSIMELKESVAAQRGSEEAQRAQVEAMKAQTNAINKQTKITVLSTAVQAAGARYQGICTTYSNRDLSPTRPKEIISSLEKLIIESNDNLKKALEQ